MYLLPFFDTITQVTLHIIRLLFGGALIRNGEGFIFYIEKTADKNLLP